jgi:hypothetical protein
LFVFVATQNQIKPNKHMKDMDSSAIDFATGKKMMQYYFDPELMVDKTSYPSHWRSNNLFIPGVMVQKDEEKGIVKLRMPKGEIVDLHSEGLVGVNSEDLDGVPDILKLHNFSEKNLIHTLRTRFYEVLKLKINRKTSSFFFCFF